MQVAIKRDLVETLGQDFSTPQSKEILSLINEVQIFEDHKVPCAYMPLKVLLSFRTDTTNEVLTLDSERPCIAFGKAVELDSEEDLKYLKGYYMLIANIQQLMRGFFKDITPDIVQKTELVPVGMFVDKALIISFVVFIKNDLKSHFEVNTEHGNLKFNKILYLSDLPNLTKWSTLILPTMKII